MTTIATLKAQFQAADGLQRIDLAWQMLALRRQEIGQLKKSNSHHDLSGRFARVSNAGVLPSSEPIRTEQEAKRYYRDHIAGQWRVTIKRKSGLFDALVNMNENQDHAYTKADAKQGVRRFDARRAQLMERLLDAIVKPDIILENGNRDLYIEKQQDGVYYAVVLEWKTGVNEYRFRSAHYWDKEEFNSNKANYGKPSVRGKKTDKNKAPERLSKSFGASSTFTRLRDALEENQVPPACQSILVQLSEPGWEPLVKGSCCPDNSIDDSPSFVNIDDWRIIVGDDDIEPLHKAHTHDTPHDIFKPHENIFIRGLVEDYYESGIIRFSGVRVALNQWLAGQRYRPENAGTLPPSPLLKYANGWSNADAESVATYLAGIEPEAFSVNEYALLAKLLVHQYLPEDVLIDAAITHAAQSYLMGAAQAAWQASHPNDTLTEAQVAALRTALPTALEGIVTAMRLSGVAKATLDYGMARAAENIVALTDDARATIQNVLMDHELTRLSGDASATAKKLEQTLGDKFADMNRDWRRIALTETGELSLQGFVATQPIGAKLKRIEHYDGACTFCKKIDGTVMEVVDPESPDKDGKSQIWVGKTNIGRSSSPRKRTEDGLVDREEHELWWLASGVIHPHCRGIWVRV